MLLMKVCSTAAGGSEGGCLKIFLPPTWYTGCCFSGYSIHTFFQILCVAPKALDKNKEGCPKTLRFYYSCNILVNGKLCLQVKLRSEQKAGYHSKCLYYRRSASPTDSLQLPSARCTFVKINLEYVRLTGLSPCLHQPLTHVYTAALRQLLSCSAVPCYPRPAKLCLPRGVTRVCGSRERQGCRAPLADEPQGRSRDQLLLHLTPGAHIQQRRGLNAALLNHPLVCSGNRQKELPFNYTQANVVWYVSIFPV